MMVPFELSKVKEAVLRPQAHGEAYTTRPCVDHHEYRLTQLLSSLLNVLVTKLLFTPRRNVVLLRRLALSASDLIVHVSHIMIFDICIENLGREIDNCVMICFRGLYDVLLLINNSASLGTIYTY